MTEPTDVPDIRTYTETRRGWWIESDATVPCILPPDGLIAIFRREDVESVLDSTYPHAILAGRKVWYFNNTRDREMAEVDGYNRVCANPQVLWKHFLKGAPS